MATRSEIAAASGLTNLPASGLAVTELWTFDPTDQVDAGSNDWSSDYDTSRTMNGLTFLVQAGLATGGPDGVNGIRVVASGAAEVMVLKIDIGDVATLGGHTRKAGDLWLIDFCVAINDANGTDEQHLYFRSGGYLLGFQQTAPTTFTREPITTYAGTVTHGMANFQRCQLRMADYAGGAGVRNIASCWGQDSATPSQDIADVIRLTKDLESSDAGDVVWIRCNVEAGGDMTITNIGIGVVPGVGQMPPALSWDYAP